MNTQRFYPPPEWKWTKHNANFIGLIRLINELSIFVEGGNIEVNFSKEPIMIEIGSYMGESTMMFASSGIFKKIYAIDPHDGDEKFNKKYNITWDWVKTQYQINTRHFKNISLISDYSYNVDYLFDDNSIDFIYIDGNHSYESVKKDLKLYLPKIKNNCVIAGHDYSPQHQGVMDAVDEVLGKPNLTFPDSSWIYIKKNKSLL